MSTWTFAHHDPMREHRCITLDGYRIALLRAFDVVQGKIRVVVMEPRAATKQRPIAWTPDGQNKADVVVRCPFKSHDQRNAFTAYRGNVRCYFTMEGWVDDRSQPLLLPYEISTP